MNVTNTSNTVIYISQNQYIASYIYLYNTSEDTTDASNAVSVNCIWWPQALFDIHVMDTDHLYAKSPAMWIVYFDNDEEVLLIENS